MNEDSEEQIFAAAIQFASGERDGYLDQVCENAQQKRRIAALIAAHESADDLLDTEAMLVAQDTAVDRPLRKAIGDFEIIRELGRGGMGVVYEARQKSLKRRVALKVLSSGLGLSSKAILRFRREAEAAGKLHHTNIVPIYTTGEDKGIHYYAMELVDGPSLDAVIGELRCESTHESQPAKSDIREDLPAWVKETALFTGLNGEAASRATIKKQSESNAEMSRSSIAFGNGYFDQVATMIADVADALDHAHEHGVIHRDIKPSNLLLAPDGRLSVNDFGLARILEQPGMTMTGEFVGSPLYMSPEQVTAGRVSIDHRTDIYSLGATLYELLVFQPPFPGKTRDQVLAQILHKDAIPPRKLHRKVPIDLDTICMKAIEKDPDRRYQTSGQLASDLRRFVSRNAISARRIGPVAKAIKLARRNKLASLLLVVLAAVLLLGTAGLLYKLEQERADRLKTTVEEIYGKVLHVDRQGIHELIDEAQSLGASEEQVWFLRGLEESSRNDHEGAMEWFGMLPDDVAAQALYASELFFSGTEVGYINRLAEIREQDIDSFEDKLFLGVANVWGNPSKAYKLLTEANRERPSLQFIETQLAEAARSRATLMEIDLGRAESLLDQAWQLTGNASTLPTVDSDCTRLLLLVDQAMLYQQVAATSPPKSSNIYQAKLTTKSDELQRFLEDVLTRKEELAEFRAFSICHAMNYLGRDEELERLTDMWYSDGVPLQAFTAHFLSTYFAKRRNYGKARSWFHLVRNSGEEFTATQFLPVLFDAVDSESGKSLEVLRERLRAECKRKEANPKASALLFFDAILLHLLGDPSYLDIIENDALSTQIFYPGSFDPIIRYFKKPVRNETDAGILLTECEQTEAPNFSVMHAHFSLAVEALVRGKQDEAARQFVLCRSGRQYLWYVYRISEILQEHRSAWGKFKHLKNGSE